jgi:hypothetical protein
MTSIDSLLDLVKSETYKIKSYFSPLRKLQEKCKIEKAVQNGPLRATTKTKVLLFFRLDSFVIVLLMGNWEWK